MQTWIARLTAFSFAMHLLLGCCWHHAHAAASEHECGDHNHDHHSPVDHNHQTDCEGSCTFLPVPRTLVDANAALPLTAFAALPVDPDWYSPSAAAEAISWAIRYGPGPRLHLLHCLLLI